MRVAFVGLLLLNIFCYLYIGYCFSHQDNKRQTHKVGPFMGGSDPHFPRILEANPHFPRILKILTFFTFLTSSLSSYFQNPHISFKPHKSCYTASFVFFYEAHK